jgi:transcriptional regulator with XRE-family HTH domain
VTQAELARRLGVTAPYVSALETGRENLTIGQLWAVADALRVELHFEYRVPPDRPSPVIASPPRRGEPNEAKIVLIC